ncbi:hypothetical protein ACFYXM_28030 [Streptomyces sp. NPDC002476]|uniref:hypothetical protein n=1 Tax=Streptomyces sp. NPDC002476 TaxID=3364648 RepID=UPI0036847D2A
MPNSHARALRTHDINEVFVQELKAREDQLRSNHVWIAPVLDQLSGGRVVTPPRYVPARFTLADQADLIDEASHVGIYRMWARRGRVTFVQCRPCTPPAPQAQGRPVVPIGR